MLKKKCKPRVPSKMMPYINLSVGSLFHAEQVAIKIEIMARNRQLILSSVAMPRSA